MKFLPYDIVEINTPGKKTAFVGADLHGWWGIVIETDFWGRVFVQFNLPGEEENIWDFIPEELILIERRS